MSLDTIENFQVDHVEAANELRTLQTLSQGLEQLYRMVKGRELRYEQSRRAGLELFSLGLDWDGTRDRLDTIVCFFHWFGNTLDNYIRLVGFVRGLANGTFSRSDLGDKTKFKAIKTACDTYRDSIREYFSVSVWRNKVFGHIAITYPFGDDNPATLAMSAMFPVTFENGRYVVGGLTHGRQEAGQIHTSELPRWSLTEVYESLVPRFWPTYVVPTVDNLPDPPQGS
jgi:hypothetical protein